MHLRRLVLGACVLIAGCGGGTSRDDTGDDGPKGDDASISGDDGGLVDARSIDAFGTEPDAQPALLTGNTCTMDPMCPGGLCGTELEMGWPGGMCTVVCDPASPSACLNGSTCYDDGVQPYCVPTCNTTADCRTGYMCFDIGPSADTGLCWPRCEENADCPATFQCNHETGYCGSTGSGAMTGDPCTQDSQCESGICQTETASGYPGGNCVTICDPTSTSNFACPISAICADASSGAGPVYGLCLDKCSAPCRDGYTCAGLGQIASVCVADCSGPEQCPATAQCNLYSGLCEPLQGLALDGAACHNDSDCESGQCFDEAWGWPGGTCVSMCRWQEPACPAGETCHPQSGMAGLCRVDCLSTAACRAGYGCWGDGVRPASCQPDCDRSSECPDTGVCDVYSGFCGATVGSPDGSDCGADPDCASGFCSPYCVSLCTVSANNCPIDTSDGVTATCLSQGAEYGDLGICYDACDDGTDCVSFSCSPFGDGLYCD